MPRLGYAHSIADLVANPNAQPCPYDHAISFIYASADTKPLTYAEWYARAHANCYRPCPDSYPNPIAHALPDPDADPGARR